MSNGLKNKKTFLYAGNIYVKIGDAKIYVSNIRINKSIATVTDSFSFTVPVDSSSNGYCYIPNIFGLKIDVFVNEEFYVSGILINKTSTDTDIHIECSTHGWQLTNSDIYEEIQYNNEVLGDFILDVCEKNFFESYLIDCKQKTLDQSYYNAFFNKNLKKEKTERESPPTLIEYSDESLKSMEKISSTKNDVLKNLILQQNIFNTKYYKKKVKFALYDPFGLYQTNIANFQDISKGQNAITSDFNETVFEFIKSVTKNVNVFIKCIGLYSDIKKTLDPQFLKMKKGNKEIIVSSVDDQETMLYVLLLFRPGQNLARTKGVNVDWNIINDRTRLEGKYTRGLKDEPFFYEIHDPLKTNQTYINYKYYNIYGYVTNDGTEKSNCLESPVENYNGTNQYSIYMLRTKEDSKTIAARTDKQSIKERQTSIDILKKADQYFQKNRFDSEIHLGNIKNIFTKNSLTEYGMNRKLNYEINKRRADSYNVSANVVGFTMDMTFAKVNSWQHKNNLFWDFGRLVLVNSPKQGLINERMIVKEMTMTFDNTSGAKTQLILIKPQAYSADELPVYTHNEAQKIKKQMQVHKKEAEDMGSIKNLAKMQAKYTTLPGLIYTYYNVKGKNNE